MTTDDKPNNAIYKWLDTGAGMLPIFKRLAVAYALLFAYVIGLDVSLMSSQRLPVQERIPYGYSLAYAVVVYVLFKR